MPLDVGTQCSGMRTVIAFVALGTAGLWVYLVRNPTSLVVADDTIVDLPGLEAMYLLGSRCLFRIADAFQ